MASRKIEDLIPEFQPKARTLIANCLARGIEMRPHQTLRDPFEQGKLWRQSRTKERVRTEIRRLQDNGAPFLAFCIESVGPQSGPPVTDSVPGLSWHQWGEAFDSFWVVDNDAEWSTERKINGLNGYHVYAEEAKKMGLTPGGLWTNFKDWPHVQLKHESGPNKLMSLEEIDQIMKQRFGS